MVAPAGVNEELPQEPAKAEPAGGGEPGWDAEEGSRDVSPLAVAGIILGVIALVGVAVGVLAVVTHGFRPKTVVTYRPAACSGCGRASASTLGRTPSPSPYCPARGRKTPRCSPRSAC